MTELEIIRHERVGGISVFFDSVEYRTAHFHPEWELVWIVSGALSVRCAQRQTLCPAGSLCVFSPNRIHEFRRGGDEATILCVQISPRLFSASFPALAALAADDFLLSDHLSEQQCASLRVRMRPLMEAYLDAAPCYELTCVSLCAAILSFLLRNYPVRTMSEDELAHTGKRNERLSRFLAYVEQNYMRRLTLEEFASAEGCSVSYMSRFLHANLNQSFQEYVNTVRYHAACRLIAAGSGRMIEICEAAGFSDYRYFSRCFKQRCGMTPEEYSRTRPLSDAFPAQRSLRSLERFYTVEESKQLLQTL